MTKPLSPSPTKRVQRVLFRIFTLKKRSKRKAVPAKTPSGRDKTALRYGGMVCGDGAETDPEPNYYKWFGL